MKKALVVACLASLPLVAQAVEQDAGFYLGAEVGRTSIDYIAGTDGDDDGLGIFAGYHFGNNFSVELGYRDLYDASWAPAGGYPHYSSNLEAEAIQLAGQYQFPLSDAFSIGVRAGVAHIESKAKVETTVSYLPDLINPDFDRASPERISHTNKVSETVIFGGVGAYYRVGSITLRATYDLYDDAEELEIDVFAIGAAWNF